MQFNKWLESNKISEKVQADFGISFTNKIVFPVHDPDGVFLFNKYRRSPLSDEGPKYTYDKGGKVTLYGYHLAKEHNTILITEGEKDCLVAWSHNIPAVTSTGGAQSFQKEWVSLFLFTNKSTDPKDYINGVLPPKQVIICYDNDEAGAIGMVKTLEILPWAKIVFIPDMPNVKDISDYVNMGGNLHELLKTAKSFENIAEVKEDRASRLAVFQSVRFHDAYIKAHTKVNEYKGTRKTYSSDIVTNANEYPITDLLQFKNNKTKCPFHADKTASLHYYEKDNKCYCFGSCGKVYNAIDIFRKINDCTFKEAVNFLKKS